MLSDVQPGMPSGGGTPPSLFFFDHTVHGDSTPPSTPPRLPLATPTKKYLAKPVTTIRQGLILKQRFGQVWADRYFTLKRVNNATTLEYYIKRPSSDAPSKTRGVYTLSSGSVVTKVTEVPLVQTIFKSKREQGKEKWDDKIDNGTKWMPSNPSTTEKMYQFQLILPNNLPPPPSHPPLDTLPGRTSPITSPSLLSRVTDQYSHVQTRLATKSTVGDGVGSNLGTGQKRSGVAGAAGVAAVVSTTLAVTVLSGGIAFVPVLVTLGMGAIAGGAAVGYNAAESDKVTVVTLACTSRKEAVRWGQVISAGIEENEGRAGKFSSLRKGIKVDKQQKFKGLSGLFKRLHYRYNPMVPSTIVDMLAWLDEGAAGTLWGDSVLTRGMRVVGEQQCMDKYVPYRSVLGGARRTQVSVANTAPDVFLRAMFLGKRTTKTQSEARKFESCRVRTLGSLGPFKDIVLVSVPSTTVFWTKPLCFLGIQGHEREFLCVRRWETEENGAFILTFEPFEEEHEKEWNKLRNPSGEQQTSPAALFTFDDDSEAEEDDEEDSDAEESPQEWKRRGKRYIVPSEMNAWNGSLHACWTVSPVKHGRPGGAPLNCLLRGTVLCRPGGYLEYIAVCLRFIFGSDLIGAYTTALLVKAVQDVKWSSERDLEEGGKSVPRDGRLKRSGSSSFLLNGKSELEMRLRKKRIEVREVEGKVVDAFDVDKKVLLRLRGLLREVGMLEEELRGWQGEAMDSRDGRIEKPQRWLRRVSGRTLERATAGEGLLRMLLGFVIAWVLGEWAWSWGELGKGLGGLEELVVQKLGGGEWLEDGRIRGDACFIVMCAFVGLFKLVP